MIGQKKEIIHVCKRLLLLVVLLIIADKSLGLLLEHTYFQQKRKYTYGIEQCREDILIFGSSRAQHHYIPSIISDSTGLTCYNLGSGGQNIYYHYGMLKAVLNRYTPKVVILDLNAIDIYQTGPSHDKDKLIVFLPFYYRNPSVQEVVNLRGSSEQIKTLFSLYRYNSLPFDILLNQFHYKGIEVAYKQSGYIPINGVYNKEIRSFQEKEISQLDSAKIKYLYKFMDLCQTKGVKCIISTSPYFARFEDKTIDPFVKIDSLVQLKGSRLHNFSNDPALINREMFRDVMHLNNEGARRFSMLVVKKISKL